MEEFKPVPKDERFFLQLTIQGIKPVKIEKLKSIIQYKVSSSLQANNRIIFLHISIILRKILYTSFFKCSKHHQ